MIICNKISTAANSASLLMVVILTIAAVCNLSRLGYSKEVNGLKESSGGLIATKYVTDSFESIPGILNRDGAIVPNLDDSQLLQQQRQLEEEEEVKEEQISSRKLWNTRIQDPKVLHKLAATSIVANKTIYGAILSKHPNWEKIETVPSSMTAEHYNSYKEAMRNLTKELPFPVAFWPYVHTKLCPQNRHARFRGHGHMANKTENGAAHSHFQIWQDFAYFDYDVTSQYTRGDIKAGELYSSTEFSSLGGLFQAYSNGSFLKNGVPYKDEDILVVMEDYSEVAITNASTVMIDELSKMNADVLFLGWCDPKSATQMPTCTYAYAITRKAAHFLVKNFEPCALAVEELFSKLCKHDGSGSSSSSSKLSWRLAHVWSYSFNSKYPRHGDKSNGFFHKHSKQLVYNPHVL